VASYNLKNGEKRYFRFHENRDWNHDQDYLANENFKFEINGDDLFNLGYIYSAHIAIWISTPVTDLIENEYNIGSYITDIYKEFSDLNIVNDPPNFGYGVTEVDVMSQYWDSVRFKIINKTDASIHCLDENLDEFYLDFETSDIISYEDLEFEDEKEAEGSFFVCEPGDAVFISDKDFEFLKQDYIKRINALNAIYSKVKFPHQIKIHR
jgi:hypothetical protein